MDSGTQGGTGAGRGIGKAIAVMLAEHGAKVVVNDIGAALDGSDEDIGVGALAGAYHDTQRKMACAARLVKSGTVTERDVKKWVLAAGDEAPQDELRTLKVLRGVLQLCVLGSHITWRGRVDEIDAQISQWKS